jgi:hypothetical protein
MKTKIITILSAVMLFVFGQVKATNIDFYSDGVIQDGDEYWNVGVYDTPPNHTTVDMTGGSVDSLATFDESTFNISGGIVNTLYAAESSTVNAFGGTIGSLEAWGIGSVNVWGSVYVDVLDIREYGISTISGGTVDRAGVLGFGTINLSGGLVSRALWAGESGVVNVYGYDLNKIDSGGVYGYGFVHGKWQNGTNFNINFGSAETFSRVVLVPEPSALLLFLISVPFLRRFIK